MIQRFLFDRIDAEAARTAVRGEYDPILLPRTDEAEPPLPFLERAIAGTEIALDASVL